MFYSVSSGPLQTLPCTRSMTCRSSRTRYSASFKQKPQFISLGLFRQVPVKGRRCRVSPPQQYWYLLLANSLLNFNNYSLTLVFIDRALQVKEWKDDWPDESEAIIYCTPQDVVKNMNLGDGLDATSVRIDNYEAFAHC